MTDTPSFQQSTINVPQLLAFLLISALAVRYFFFSTSAASSTASTLSTPRASASTRASLARRVDEQHVQTLSAMFPQLDRRAILWDLMRNGGSVQATGERMLTGPGLDMPPPSFQPPPAPSPVGAPHVGSASGVDSALRQRQAGKEKVALTKPDLIERYGLAEKVAIGTMDGEREDGKGKGKPKVMWSSNKSERQAMLQRRKEEMILEARRKLEDKERAGRGKGKAIAS